jgi:predicted secreted hydrolase
MMSKTEAAVYACIAALLLAVAGCRDSRELQFPADHGPHFDTNNEWWYFTGLASDAGGRSLGFEFTIFKRRVMGTKDFAYLGHIAVSDPGTQDYAYTETLTRPPVAGIAEGIPAISITDFSLNFTDNHTIFISARSDNASLDLALTPPGDALLHGRDGTITMGDGLPSFYYSFTDLATAGSIIFKGREYTITEGRTWMDHQWGDFTAFGIIWDWFSLRLNDGSSLMLFHFRTIMGRTARTSWTYRSASGEVTRGSAFSMQAHRTYTDAAGACSFPLDWTIAIPGLHAEFTVLPLFDNQVFYSAMTPDYWEGLCSVRGSISGIPAAGSAYAELSGYCRLLDSDP